MSLTKWEIRAGAYYDSVVLMQLQRGLLTLDGVIDSGVVMATPANLELLETNNLLPAGLTASPDDLLIVVKAEDETQALAAIGQVDELLTRRKSGAATQDFRPRSLDSAVKQLPNANWVLVSVPGRYAAGVAKEALSLNKHVFLYSDNVSIEDELSLKETARQKGLLVMGPDCGTAIINGIGLGFANRIRRGSIGIVGASGTGTQAVTAHIHSLGGGISHAIGTGGRDLKAEIGAITAHQALDLLAKDEQTKVIALVSKPPSPNVATRLINAAQNAGKPVVIYFIGYPAPARRIGNLHFAVSLLETAQLAVELNNQKPNLIKQAAPVKGYLRGLFSGGTLAFETLLGLQANLTPIYSNAPITESQLIKDPLHSEAHTLIDLGDEFFMVGRLHPMIDNDLRLRRLKQEAGDPQVGMLLIDVVLGEGSHPDPASELTPLIKDLMKQRPELEFVAMLIGTDADPQNMAQQKETFEQAGVTVFESATETVAYISLRFRQETTSEFPPINLEQLNQPLAAINVGLESFYDSLIGQGAEAVQVEWRPPASGNDKMAALLAKMKSKSN